MIQRSRVPGWLAILIGVIAYLLLTQIRKILLPDSVGASPVGQSLDISLLYLICLAPGFLAAVLNAGPWWRIGGLAGYLAELARVLVGLALQAAGHPDAPPIGEPIVVTLVHAIPSAIFGIAGAALARVPISPGGR